MAEQDLAPTTEPEATSWLESLPEDLRGSQSLQNFKSVEDLAKSYVHQQPLIGADKLVKPSKDAQKEDWDAFYTKLGRPESPDKYDFSETKIPDGVRVEESDIKEFMADAHSVGLTKAQAATLFHNHMTRFGEKVSELQRQFEQRNSENDKVLRKEFGQDYDNRIAIAAQAMEKFGSKQMVEKFEAVGLAKDPDLVKAWAEVGKYLAEDTLVPGVGTSGFKMTPAEAMAEISAKRLDPEFQKAHNDAMHPGHKDAVAKMKQLFEAAYPQQ